MSTRFCPRCQANAVTVFLARNAAQPRFAVESKQRFSHGNQFGGTNRVTHRRAAHAGGRNLFDSRLAGLDIRIHEDDTAHRSEIGRHFRHQLQRLANFDIRQGSQQFDNPPRSAVVATVAVSDSNQDVVGLRRNVELQYFPKCR